MAKKQTGGNEYWNKIIYNHMQTAKKQTGGIEYGKKIIYNHM